MKLREGNVFSRVYLSVCLFTVIITHGRLDPSRHGTSLYRDPCGSAALWIWSVTEQGPSNSADFRIEVRMVSATVRYTSYWNAFLFTIPLVRLK